MVQVITHSLQLCARWQLTFIHPVQMAEQDPNLQKLKSRHRPPDYLNSLITRQDKPYSYPVPTCPHAGPHSACPWPVVPPTAHPHLSSCRAAQCLPLAWAFFSSRTSSSSSASSCSSGPHEAQAR